MRISQTLPKKRLPQKTENKNKSECEKLCQWCQPLFDALPITFFRYVRSYENGQAVAWATHDNAMMTFLDCPETQCFTIIKKHQGFCEYYDFANLEQPINLSSLYCDYPHLFEQFVYYIRTYLNTTDQKVKLQRALRIEASPSTTLKTYHKPTLNLSAQYAFMQRILPECYHLGGVHTDIRLTKREVECVAWVSKGKTAQEISQLLGIKKPTVMTYLKSLKLRLRCSTWSEIVRTLVEEWVLTHER